MTMFTAYIWAMLHYSYYVPCSCGGVLSKMGWDAHMWFNVGFTLLSVTGITLQSKQTTQVNEISTGTEPAVVVQ